MNSLLAQNTGVLGERPDDRSTFMPGNYLKKDECFDLFIDFIESDEWLLPIESFIDYFCIAFPTPEPTVHLAEKTKIFDEYT